jgi:hypothetical protein
MLSYLRQALAWLQGAEGPRPRFDAVALVAGLLAVVSCVARVLQHVGLRYVDEDETIFWHAAQDFAHFQFHEPRFYGQDYNALLDSLVAAPWVLLGAPVQFVIPLCTATLAVLPWVLLGVCAFRQRRPWLAALLPALPLLLHTDFLLFSAMPRGFFSGIALCSCAIPLVVLGAPTGPRVLLTALLIGLGAAVGPGSLLLGAPLLMHVLLRAPLAWTTLGGALLGLGVAVAIHYAAASFYEFHPDYAVFKLGELRMERALFDKGWGQLDVHFRSIAPRAWLHGNAIPAAGAILCLWAMATRHVPLVLPALVAAAAPVLALGVSKAHSGHLNSLFLPHARLFLGVPVAFAALALMARLGGPRQRLHTLLGAMATVFVFALTIESQVRLGRALDDRLAGSPYQVPHRNKAWLQRACDTELALLREYGAEVAVHVQHNAPAYGCAAIHWGQLPTLFPESERRTWRWLEESAAPRQRMLLVHASGVCGPLLALGAQQCRRVNEDPPIDLVVFPAPVNLKEVLTRAGLRWR